MPHPGSTDAMRFFTPTDCDRVAQFGDITHVPPTAPPPPAAPLPPMTAQHQSPTGDMEPSFTKVEGHGFDCLVISSGGDISVWDGELVLGHKRLSTFPPAANHGCVQAGDIDPDPQSPGDEIVVSTTAGKVVWFKLSDLTTPGIALTGPDFVRWNAGHFVTENGETFEHRCNTSLAATWALAADPVVSGAPGTIHAIDRTGTWWDVDPISGRPTWRRETLGGTSLVRSLAPTFTAGSGGSQPHLSWEMVPYGSAWLLATTPYVPNPTIVPPAPPAWWIPQGGYRPFAPVEDGHWLLSPGASYLDASNSRMWVAWWQRSFSYYDLVQRVTYDLHDPGPATVHDVWGSTQRDLGGALPPKFPDTHPDYLPPLRSEVGAVTPMNYQAVRIARVLKSRAEPQVIVSAAGGRVMVLDGANGRILAESDDYGFGGMALAVADIYDNGNDGLGEIIFAPIYSPIEHGGGSVRAYIHVLTSNAAGDGLIRVPGSAPVPVGEIGNADFQGYGTSGIAVIDDPLVAPDKRIVVTTLNGELVVFGQTNGVINATPIYRGIFEGSLGGYGSIMIENLDPGNAKPELYIAGSAGIRRFDFQ